jgi:quercetin dioxygenase-like cupin family protein
MKNRLSLAVPLLLLSSVAAAQTSRDAVAIDPTHHNVLFENDHVRVFRALAAPGARSPMHTHPRRILVSLTTARLRFALPDGSTPIFDLHPGQVLWMDADQHGWEMLSGLVHVIGVEIKSAVRGTPPAPTPPATDAVAADPVAHQVAFENEHVRVLSGLAGSGYRSPMHSHPGDFVIISAGRVRLRLTPQGGSPTVIDLYPGQVLWLERQAHSWEILAGQHNAFAVEPKSTWR